MKKNKGNRFGFVWFVVMESWVSRVMNNNILGMDNWDKEFPVPLSSQHFLTIPDFYSVIIFFFYFI